jgi:hypothetical protein
VISLTTTPLRSTSAASHASGVPWGTTRPRAIIIATSHRVIEAMASPPALAARRIAAVAEPESRRGSRPSQSHA